MRMPRIRWTIRANHGRRGDRGVVLLAPCGDPADHRSDDPRALGEDRDCPFCGRGGVDSVTFVAIHHEYRIWSNRHVVPCLEVWTEDGIRATYPIESRSRCGPVRIVRNAKRPEIWLVDPMPSTVAD